jgi:hypothetical protein
MFVLDKMSVPGWQFKTDHIEKVFWLLDQCVCSCCKMTKQEYTNHEGQYEVDEDLGGDVNPFTFQDFKPETYDQWSTLEKVEWLMGTACGCEFDFYDEADGSDLSFVEIKS